ncbi:hypothetical protein K431DRAFT_280472 [Polychaeton citri CBS 116435]|uniref:Uncharacterized protein n=1 Tax=Polychaeton citri CBS 116435 TaxID=1314669 RepID=A0A9P4QIZ2_9PEZI|nr:hypothetical protein K431DRAFT_280472 [Polychaeton citri CBS 116435]
MARLRNQLNAPSQPQQTSIRTTRATRATRVALKEKTNVTRSLRYPGDGDTEAFVKDARPRRGRSAQATARHDSEFLMTGAIGDLRSQHVSSGNGTVVTSTDPIARGDAPANATVKVATGKRKRGQSKKENVQDEQFDEIVVSASETTVKPAHKSHRVESATMAAMPISQAERSSIASKSTDDTVILGSSLELSLSSPPESSPASGSLGFRRRNSMVQPSSALRNPETPAFESSVLLKNFRRRPRQPSMLAMVQQHQQAMNAKISNVGVDTSRLEMSETEGHDTTFGVEAGLDSDGEAGDFAPDAEGTPLQHVTINSAFFNGSTTSKLKARGRKRLSNGPGDTPGALAALRAKNRKSQTNSGMLSNPTHQGDEEDTLSQPIASSPPRQINEDELDSDIQVMRSSPVMSLPSSPQRPNKLVQQPSLARKDTTEINNVAIPSTDPEGNKTGKHKPAAASMHVGHAKPAGVDDTTAEPVSSSPSRAGGQTEEDIMAYPLTQPTQQSPRQVKKKKPPKPIGTASLQSLLPKQRRVLQPRSRRSDYDLESSDVADDGNDTAVDMTDSDGDESGFGSRRRPTSRRSKVNDKGTSRQMRSARDRKNRVTSSRLTTRASITQNAPAADGRLGRKIGRTYGRTVAADKEVDELHESASDAEAEESIIPASTSIEAAKSKELEDAKRKFAEIDQWDGLEFENLDSEDHRSSSQGWR